jgi:hypothetical protein
LAAEAIGTALLIATVVGSGAVVATAFFGWLLRGDDPPSG